MRAMYLRVVFALILALASYVLVRADPFDIPTSPTNKIAACPRPTWASRQLVECFYKSALAFRKHSTKWRGTQCPPHTSSYRNWGHCACAAAVSVVIMNATRSNLGIINVDVYNTLARSNKLGGGFVSDQHARQGDVILWYSNDYSEAHIGFCATNGCTQTWSNSSSRGVFAPVVHTIDLDGYYPQHFIWQPEHLP